MSCASHSCKRMPVAGLLGIFVLTLYSGAAVLRAQDTLPPASQSPPASVPAQATVPVSAPVDVPTPAPTFAPVPTPVPSGLDAAPAEDSSPSNSGLKHGSSGSAHGRGAPRYASQGFSFWDRTLLDASQHSGGARASHSSAPGGQFGSPRTGLGSWGDESGSVRTRPNPWGGEPDDLESLFQGANAPSFGRSRSSGGVDPGMNGAHGSAPGDLKLNQLTRGDLGMYLKSSMGNFRLFYRDALGTRSNGIGGGAGRGSPGASFNSSTFGNGMFNLSATSTLGSGPTSASSRGGFSSGPMSGPGHGSPTNPSGTEKRPSASVSLHLHF